MVITSNGGWTWLPQHRPFQPRPRMPSDIRILRIAKRVFFSWAGESIGFKARWWSPTWWFLEVLFIFTGLNGLQNDWMSSILFHSRSEQCFRTSSLLGWLNNKAVPRPRHSELRARCQNPVLPELQRRKGDILWPLCLLQRKHDSPLGLTCPNPWDVPKFMAQPRSFASKHVSRVQALLKSQKHLPRPSNVPVKNHVYPSYVFSTVSDLCYFFFR